MGNKPTAIPTESADSSHEAAGANAALIGARLVVNLTRRFPYPFLPNISHLLGVPAAQLEGLIGLQAGVGLMSPPLGSLSDRLGRRPVLLTSLAVLTFGSAVAAVWPRYGCIVLTFLLFGIAKAAYDPAMQAYLADRVPYERRAIIMGVSELSWAGALLVGAPVVGFMLAHQGLSGVFAVLMSASAGAFFIVLIAVPRESRTSVPPFTTAATERTGGLGKKVLCHPQALAALLCTACLTAGNESLLIVYSSWMQSSFAVGIAALGIASAILAVAELVGEGIVILVGDRCGKLRLLLGSVIAIAICYAALPYISKGLASATLGLFLAVAAFEVALVLTLSVFSEVLPSARGAMLSANVAADRAGRMVGAWAGAFLYSEFGFVANSWTSVTLAVTALLLLWGMLNETRLA